MTEKEKLDLVCLSFKKNLEEYNYNSLVNIFEKWKVKPVVKRKTKEICNLLKRFVKEYSLNEYKQDTMYDLLSFINNFELFKEICYLNYKKNQQLFAAFINYGIKKQINMDEHILYCAKNCTMNSFEHIEIILKAIHLKENNISLRKKYYRYVKYMNETGFLLLMEKGIDTSLCKDDLFYIKLDDFSKLGYIDVLEILEILSYPESNVMEDDRYSYKKPIFYSYNDPLIFNGALKYREYLNEKFDLNNRLDELLNRGIEHRIKDIEIENEGYHNVALYIFSLDCLSSFKYNLKQKVEQKYRDCYPQLIEELNIRYK